MKVHKADIGTTNYTDYDIGDIEIYNEKSLLLVVPKKERRRTRSITNDTCIETGKQIFFKILTFTHKLLKNNKINKQLYKNKIESENQEYLLVKK